LRILAILALAAAPAQTAAGRIQDAEIVRSIEAQGADRPRSGCGALSHLAGSHLATDADVERIASLQEPETLDLSLTYVSDRGQSA